MQMTIKKVGNSLATRIPKAIVDAVGLELDQEVNIESVDGKIIITPCKRNIEYSLDELLDQCDSDKMEISQEDRRWLNDPPVSREAW